MLWISEGKGLYIGTTSISDVHTQQHITRTKGLKEAAYETPPPRTRRSDEGRSQGEQSRFKEGGGSAARRMECLERRWTSAYNVQKTKRAVESKLMTEQIGLKKRYRRYGCGKFFLRRSGRPRVDSKQRIHDRRGAQHCHGT